jgi:hypothetical protein
VLDCSWNIYAVTAIAVQEDNSQKTVTVDSRLKHN